jgi:hypothetical protein
VSGTQASHFASGRRTWERAIIPVKQRLIYLLVALYTVAVAFIFSAIGGYPVPVAFIASAIGVGAALLGLWLGNRIVRQRRG